VEKYFVLETNFVSVSIKLRNKGFALNGVSDSPKKT
jgi:hypothetical protein